MKGDDSTGYMTATIFVNAPKNVLGLFIIGGNYEKIKCEFNQFREF